MILALPKLLITLLNFLTYLAFPGLPVYIATTHEFSYKRPAILNYGEDKKGEHQVPEFLIVSLFLIFLILAFVQFHVLRFLFSLRIPGFTLRRQKV